MIFYLKFELATSLGNYFKLNERKRILMKETDIFLIERDS